MSFSQKAISPTSRERSVRSSLMRSSEKKESILENNVRKPTKLDCSDLKHIAVPHKDLNADISRETKKLIKSNKLNTSQPGSKLNMEKSSLAVELEDPANEYLRVDIQRVMQMSSEVSSLEQDYKNLEEAKNEIRSELQELMKKDFTKANCLVTHTQCNLLIKIRFIIFERIIKTYRQL